MIAKLLGLVLVISGFGGWGLSGARCLRRRVAQLQDLQTALGFLEKEISYMYSPLSQALENTAHFSTAPVSTLFAVSSGLLREKSGLTACEAWLQGLAELRQTAQLQGPDYELLSTAAQQLGVSDAVQQSKFLTSLQEQLKICEEKARRNMESGQKLWTYGGFLTGLLVALLLI